MTSIIRSNDSSKQGDSVGAPGDNCDNSLLARLQASSLACLVTDRSYAITGCNSGAEALLGVKAEEILHKPFSTLISNGKRFAENAKKASKLGCSGASFQKANGEMVEVKIWSFELPSSARHLFLLQDVTEKEFLESALLEAAEREQGRIGRELHDQLCQHLLGAAFAAGALAGTMDREQSRHAPRLHELAQLINDAVTQAREISRGLCAVELGSRGLISALQELADRIRRVTACTFSYEEDILVKDSGVARNAYRIAQETITSFQGAEAKSIEIALFQAGDSLCLQISNDGKKESELTANPAGVAARTLHYRAKAMRGSLALGFHPKKGTRIACFFPA